MVRVSGFSYKRGGKAAMVDAIRAAFIPFGDIKGILAPAYDNTGVSKGFAYVRYEYPEDAEAALDNMDGAELQGKTLSVRIARKVKRKIGSMNAIWDEDPDGDGTAGDATPGEWS